MNEFSSLGVSQVVKSNFRLLLLYYFNYIHRHNVVVNAIKAAVERCPKQDCKQANKKTKSHTNTATSESHSNRCHAQMWGHCRGGKTAVWPLSLPRVCTCRDTPECYTAPPGQEAKLSVFNPDCRREPDSESLSTHLHLRPPRTTHVIVVLFDDGLVEADGLLVLVLHEEHVGNVELPSVVLVTDLHRFAENLLHHLEVLSVPVDLRLSHQDHNVPVVRQRIRPDGEGSCFNVSLTNYDCVFECVCPSHFSCIRS